MPHWTRCDAGRHSIAETAALWDGDIWSAAGFEELAELPRIWPAPTAMLASVPSLQDCITAAAPAIGGAMFAVDTAPTRAPRARRPAVSDSESDDDTPPRRQGQGTPFQPWIGAAEGPLWCTNTETARAALLDRWEGKCFASDSQSYTGKVVGFEV